MKRVCVLAVCLALAPLAAQAAGLTAELSGTAGSGLAVIAISGNTIDYNILVSGIESPSTATITGGAVSVDLEATFVGGSAFGTVTDSHAGAIAADPSSYTVTVSNGSASISGVLQGDPSSGEPTTVYFPITAAIAGQAGTSFLTDVRLINLSGGDVAVTLEFFASGASGHSSPTATATVSVASGEEAVLDDMVAELFGITDGRGAVRAMADREISGFARIYNDQTDASPSGGTLGQFVAGLGMADALDAGMLPFLSNDDPATGAGYRSNIGWFNPSTTPVTLTLESWDAATGASLGSVTRTVQGLAQEQYNVAANQLWPALGTHGSFYVTFTTSGGDLFLYASIVDNVNGDAIYAAAAGR